METGQIKRREVPFSQISNSALRDEKLSLKAKGLYALIQSYITIPNFILYKTTLMKQCKESKNTFDTAWKELKDNGYLIQYKKSNIKTKTFYYDYELLDIKIEIVKEEKATTQKAVHGKPSTWENGSYNNTDINNTDLNNTENYIKGAFSNEKTLSIRYKSKEEFLNSLNYSLDSNEFKISEMIYRNFLGQIGCNSYRLDTEQLEKAKEGIKLINEVTEDWEQVKKVIQQYFRLERAYYSIQDFTNLNTLSYLLSITGIAEIPERFDKNGKFEGIV